MMTDQKTCLSAPECQLTKYGSPQSYELLLNSAKGLSDEALGALEDDLQYYSKTGLIGVNMSRMLAMLQTKGPGLAA